MALLRAAWYKTKDKTARKERAERRTKSNFTLSRAHNGKRKIDFIQIGKTKMLNMTVHGRLGRDAELNETPQGSKVCNFAVATDTRNKETVWHSCAIWGAYGETMHQYLTKGRQVCVSGEWEPQQGKNGNTYYNLRVTQMSLGADPRGQRDDGENDQGTDSRDLDDAIPF